MLAQHIGRDPRRLRRVGQRSLGIVGDRREVRRALYVQATVALTGGGPDNVDPTLRDCMWIQTVGVARHKRHAGHADDVGFAAGQGQHPRSAPADHDRRMRALNGAGPTRIALHVNEVAGAVQFLACPVRLDERDDFGEFGDSPARPVEGQSHCGVLGLAPAGPDAHFQPTIGQQIQGRCLLGQDGRHVIVDAEHPAPDAERFADRGRRRHRRDRGEVLARGTRGFLCRAGAQVVIREEKC